MYENGRQRWHYLVPDDPAERRQLGSLCQRMLSLERHYLDVYATFLQAIKLRSDQNAAHAVEALKRIGHG
jgi:hypothetical protein